MRGIEHLHPKMRAKAEELLKICGEKGMPLLITETFRTTAEQDALYAQGRTAPGNIVTNAKGSSYQSGHQWGVAFDFCRNVKGKEWDDSDGFFLKVGVLGKSIGLAWGGDWKTPDKPHLELPEFMPGNSTATLRAQYGTPDNFKKAWEGNIVKLKNLPALKKGAKAQPAVDALRALLNVRLGKNFKMGKSFGALTETAVKEFQKAAGLAAVDGVCGPKTWAALGVNS